MSTSATPAISNVPQKSLSVASASALRIGLREAEQLQVARLEHERQRLGERGVRHTLRARVVDVVERERLLDVVAQLVDRDVVALVVHPAGARRACAGAALSPRRCAPQRVARAARRIDDDVAREVARPLGREAELAAGCRECPAAKASAVGYFLRRDRVELGLACTLPRGRKPSYQMSNGSSGRPRRCLDQLRDAAARAATRAPARASPSTRASGISRSSSKRARDRASAPWASRDRPGARRGTSPRIVA